MELKLKWDKFKFTKGVIYTFTLQLLIGIKNEQWSMKKFKQCE